MINEEKIVEFLEQHKRNPENHNSEGNYDPNPYWFAEELIKLFVNYNESREKICPTCKGKGHI